MNNEFAHFYCPGPHPGIERFKACIVQRSFPVHFHEGYVFGVIQRGHQLLVINGKSYAAPAGSLIFLKPYDLHAVSSADSSAVTYQTLHVPASLMAELVEHDLDARQPVVHAPHLAEQITDAFEQLDGCASSQEWNKMFMGVLRVLSPLLQLPATPRSSGIPCLARDVLSLIHQQTSKPLRIAALSDSLGVSHQYLIRQFKRVTGVTPYSYLLAHRTALAKELLRSVEPAEAAAHAGFADQSHLTRRLQACYGTTPSAYRRLLVAQRGDRA